MSKGIIVQYYHGGWHKWVLYHLKEERILETRKRKWARIPERDKKDG